MRVRVYGENRFVAAVVRDGARWCLSRLLCERSSAIDLRIQTIKNLKRSTRRGDGGAGIFGSSRPMRHGRFPKSFCIELDTSYGRAQVFRTLFHELVHVRQYATNQLYDYPDGMTRWKRMRMRDREDVTKIEHKRKPWEHEAYKLETSLYAEWRASLDSSDDFFSLPVR